MADVLYDVTDAVATVTINRPERHNALSWATVGELQGRMAEAGDDDAVRVVVLTGAGDRAFSAGADLGGMAAGAPYLELHEGRGRMSDLFRTMWGLGKPTIARVRGWCLAGGFGLALACDLVVAAADATFGATEVNVGLWPFQITVPLVRSMPPKKALELMLTGRQVSAEEADRIGFLTKVVPVDRLDEETSELAAGLASLPPAAVRLGRDSFYRVWDQSAADALPLLHALLTVVNGSDDAKEGIAAFHEKREPRWTGR